MLIRFAKQRLLDTLFPARCPGCQEFIGNHGGLCAACWTKMQFINAPLCQACGLPFDFELGGETLCGRCLQSKPIFREARSLLRYDEHSRAPILALKYHDKTQLAPMFGAWLARLAAPYQPKVQAVVPVPLHYIRFLGRRYNQSALLAKALSQLSGVEYIPDTLKRVKPTPKQAGLSLRQREENMRGAFAVPRAKRETLKGKSVLLIDDVMTTGATLNACARALHDAGAVDVYALTIARTVLAD